MKTKIDCYVVNGKDPENRITAEKWITEKIKAGYIGDIIPVSIETAKKETGRFPVFAYMKDRDGQLLNVMY